MVVNLVSFNPECITQEYLTWLNDRNLMRFSRQSRSSHSRESCISYLRSFENTTNYFWSVRNDDNVQVGTMSAYVDAASHVADLGIMIGSSGKGYGKEAWGMALTLLFEKDKMRKVTAGTLSVHNKMIKIFEHWSMRREGFLRQQEYLNGVTYDVVRYGLLKEEWALTNVSATHDNFESTC